MKCLAATLLVIFLFSCVQISEDAEISGSENSTKKKLSVAEKAINQKVLDAYALISFEKGETPDFAGFDDVFTPYATLLNFRDDTLARSSIGDFKIMFEQMVNSGQVESFHEIEESGKTEYFGKIGHRISTYATYINTRDSIAERGINSFQLINIDGQWKVNSIIWDVEKPGNPIPE